MLEKTLEEHMMQKVQKIHQSAKTAVKAEYPTASALTVAFMGIV